MATVASLLVKLGLDSKGFDKGVRRATQGLNALITGFDRVGAVGRMTSIVTAAGALTALGAAAAPAAGALLAVPAAAVLAGAGAATLAAGLSGVGEAMAATGGTAEELEKALSGLAPAAQSFVKSWAGVREAFQPVQQAVQQRLFGGLGEELSALATQVMPTVKSGMTAVASALNSLGAEALTTMQQPLFQGQLADIFDVTAEATNSFKGAVGPLITVLSQLAIAGLPLVTRFGEWVSGGLASAAAFLSTEAGAARLSDIVQRAGDTLAQLGSIAGNLGSALSGIFGAASIDGASLLDTVEQLTARFAAWVNSAQGQEQLAQVFGLLTQVAADLLAILPGIASVIGTIATAFTSLPPGVQSVVTQFLAWSIVIGAVAGRLGPLAGGIQTLSGGLLALGRNIANPETALGKFSRRLLDLGKTAGAALARLGATLIRIGTQALLMGARMLAGWIMGMGPIGWIIAAIVALVALVILYWDQIVAAITTAWGWVKQATMTAWNAVIAWLTGIWESIKSTVAAVWQWIKDTISNLWNQVVNLFMTFHPVGILMSHWDQIKAAAAAAWQWIKTTISNLWNGLVGFLSSGVAAVTTFISTGWNAIKAATSAVWNGIKATVNGVWNTLKSLVSGAVSTVKNTISGAWNTVKSLTSSAWNGIKNAVTSRVSSLLSTVRGIPGRIKSALGNMGRLLYNAGRNVISGLIDGIRSMISSVGSAMSGIADKIRGFLPFSPAKEGPLSGSGNPYNSGRSIARLVAGGITSQQAAIDAAMAAMTRRVAVGMPGMDGGGELALAGATGAHGTGSAVHIENFHATERMSPHDIGESLWGLVKARG